MRQPLLTLLLLFVPASFLYSQSTAYITGKVVDGHSEPVYPATISWLGSGREAYTHTDGTFRIDHLPRGYCELVVTSAGFANRHYTFQLTGDTANVLIHLQPEREALGEVIVNGEKQAGRLQDLPVAISAFSEKDIARFRIWNLSQLSNLVPALYTANPGDNRNVTSIRGITSVSYDPAVVTYIDGVSQFGLDTYLPELVDAESIEVLRGPQSTLYGRNAMGGVILVKTKEPGYKRSAFVEASTGNYGLQRYKAGFRTPLVKDRLLLGTTVLYNSRNGYYTNDNKDEQYDLQHSVSGNHYLRWLPGKRWSVLLNAKYDLGRNYGAFPLAPTIIDALSRPYHLSQDATSVMKDNTWNASLSVTHQAEKIRFVSETGYQSNYRYYEQQVDADFSPANGISIYNNYGRDWNKTQAVTQELRISSADRGPRQITWVAGTYLFWQKSPVKQGTVFGRDALQMGATDTLFRIINTSTGYNYGIAFFGQCTIPLAAKLRLIAGLRYDRQQSELMVRSDYSSEVNGTFPIQPDSSASTGYGALSPKLGLSYRLDENHHLYASYSRGFRTGGLSPISSDPSQPALYPYKPEYSNNMEAGVKSSLFKDRLQVNLAAFYILVNDIQVPALVLPAAITVIQNAGKLESKGIEAEVSALVYKHLSMRYSFGYTAATYRALIVPSNGVEVDLKGNRQVFTPDITSALAAQYFCRLHQRRNIHLSIQGEWTYTGQQYFDQANQLGQSPYHQLHGMLRLSIPDFEVAVWARNLSGTRFVDYAYNFGAAHLGAPRTYGVTLRYTLR